MNMFAGDEVITYLCSTPTVPVSVEHLALVEAGQVDLADDASTLADITLLRHALVEALGVRCYDTPLVGYFDIDTYWQALTLAEQADAGFERQTTELAADRARYAIDFAAGVAA